MIKYAGAESANSSSQEKNGPAALTNSQQKFLTQYGTRRMVRLRPCRDPYLGLDPRSIHVHMSTKLQYIS